MKRRKCGHETRGCCKVCRKCFACCGCPKCLCLRYYPYEEDREKCPLHRAAARPEGFNYWNGGEMEWQAEPAWRGQRPYLVAEGSND